MPTYNWYSQLIKPSWAPPSWIFGPVWSVLYVLIAISFGTVFYKAFTKQIPWMVSLPFVLNLIFNFAGLFILLAGFTIGLGAVTVMDCGVVLV